MAGEQEDMDLELEDIEMTDEERRAITHGDDVELDPDADDDDELDMDADPDADPDAGGGKGGKQDDVDPEADPDADPDADHEADPAADPAAGKSRTVPHARFNEVNEALKAEREARLRLEEELARAKGGKQQEPDKPKDEPKAYDFDGAEDRYIAAVLEGDAEGAKKIRNEIRTEERKTYEQAASKTAQESVAEERQRLAAEAQQRAVGLVLTEAYEKYPFLDHTGAKANSEAIQEVIDWRDMYVQRGKSLAEAIRMAVDKVGPAFDKKAPVADGQQPKDQRKPAAVKRNAEAERQQPPQMPGTGARQRPTEIDVESMSEDEFDALSDAELKALRQ